MRDTMKGKLAGFAFGVIVLSGTARAAGPDAAPNPYSVILQHSVFGLVPPPTPPEDVSVAVSPPDIALNGIMSIFGRKYALFKLSANKGKTYLLGEGQSDGEIRLLAVEERAGKIKISNHGIVQTISLAKPPATTGQPAAGAAPNAAPFVAAGNNPRQSPAEGIAPAAFEKNPMPVAMPVATAGFYAGAGGGNSGNSQGGSSGGTPSSSGDSGSQSSGGSNSAPRPEPDPWWVIGSKSMEAARIATVSQVNSGQAEPWPLTPFTPPGTPASLIGPERLYFGHGVYHGVDSGDQVPD
jgi:uncharacterized membrane protein YgcG